MINITREFQFDIAHRVLKHESKCKSLHGHRIKAEVTISSKNGLDSLGRVLDFGKMKEVIGEWIDFNWDHNIILNEDDPLVKIWNMRLTEDNNQLITLFDNVFQGKKPYIIQGNPTAEILAKILYLKARDLLLPFNLQVEKVIFWETPNCRAEYYEQKVFHNS